MPRPLTIPFRAVVAVTILATLGGCLPPNVYSRVPTDPDGVAIDARTLDAFELGQDFRYELQSGESLQVETDALVLLSKPDEFGTRRSRRYPLEEVLQVRQRLEDGTTRWLQTATIEDFSQLEPLPKIDALVLGDGRNVSIDPRANVRWSADRLALVVEAQGSQAQGSQPQRYPLTEIRSVLLVRGNPVLATLGSWKFWAVTGAASALAIWVSGLEDEDSLATR